PGRDPGPDVPSQQPGDRGDPVVMRWAFAQWATDTQLGEVAAGLAGAGSAGAGLLLDLPGGGDPGGDDPWVHPEAFAVGATIGAPPDRFFLGGQDWDLPPPHPAADRAGGYPVL